MSFPEIRNFTSQFQQPESFSQQRALPPRHAQSVPLHHMRRIQLVNQLAARSGSAPATFRPISENVAGSCQPIREQISESRCFTPAPGDWQDEEKGSPESRCFTPPPSELEDEVDGFYAIANEGRVDSSASSEEEIVFPKRTFSNAAAKRGLNSKPKRRKCLPVIPEHGAVARTNSAAASVFPRGANPTQGPQERSPLSFGPAFLHLRPLSHPSMPVKPPQREVFHWDSQSSEMQD